MPAAEKCCSGENPLVKQSNDLEVNPGLTTGQVSFGRFITSFEPKFPPLYNGGTKTMLMALQIINIEHLKQAHT